MKTEEEKLFNLIESIGECIEGDLHIINIGDEYPNYEGEKRYRVYHKDGLCMDVFKEAGKVDEKTDSVKTWNYDYTQGWEELTHYTIDNIFRIINNVTNNYI